MADVDSAGPLDPGYERRLARQAAVAALVALQQASPVQEPDSEAEAAPGGFAAPARAVRRGRPAGAWAHRV